MPERPDIGRDRDAPRVSVIVPTHNGERTLPTLLDSLQRVDYPSGKLEVVIVDNNSTDASADVAARWPSVRVLREPTPGAYPARNTGIAAAEGDILAFTDDDCEVQGEWLRAAVARFADPRVGVVAGRILPHEATNRVEQYLAGKLEHDPATTFGRGHPPWAAGGNAFYRRAVFDQLGPFDAAMTSGGDVEMSWRAQLQGGWSLVMCPESAVWHRHAATLGSMFRQQKRYGYGRVQIHMRVPDVEPFEGVSELYWRWRLMIEHTWRFLRRYPQLSGGKGWRAFAESADVLRLLQRVAYNWGRLVGSVKFRTLYP